MSRDDPSTGSSSSSGTSGLDGLPLEELRSAALERAAALGCSHAEVRVERIRSQFVALRDGHVETTVDDTELGIGLHVVRDGSFGFAATVELKDPARDVVEEVAVVGHDQDGAGIVAQMSFQP